MASVLSKSRFRVLLTVVLLLEGALFYTARSLEAVPKSSPLVLFPTDVGEWHAVRDVAVEKEVQEVLRADDILNRLYIASEHPAGLSMFIAYFRSQRAGQTPHSPKNCLPGSGWEPVQEGVITVPISGQDPITINRYIVAHGDAARVVLYWYQSHKRVIASDYAAKFWVVADSVRYHRSDTAIVRVEVPILGDNTDRATQTAVEFVQLMFPQLKAFLPA